MTVAQVRELRKYLNGLSEWGIRDNLDAINTDSEGNVTIHTHHSTDTYVDTIKPDGTIIYHEEGR